MYGKIMRVSLSLFVAAVIAAIGIVIAESWYWGFAYVSAGLFAASAAAFVAAVVIGKVRHEKAADDTMWEVVSFAVFAAAVAVFGIDAVLAAIIVAVVVAFVIVVLVCR